MAPTQQKQHSPTPTIVISSSSSSSSCWTSSTTTSSTGGSGSVVLSSAFAILSASSSPVTGDDEATSRLRRGPYRCWALDDEIKIIDTIAALRRDNMGHLPDAAVLLRALQAADPPLLRRGLDAAVLSQKVYNLKIKFRSAAMAAAINGGKRLRNKRNKALYHHSKKAWPEELRQGQPTAANNNQLRRVRTSSYGGATCSCRIAF